MSPKRIFLAVLAVLLIGLIAFIGVDLYHYSQNKSPYRTLVIPRLEMGHFEITELSSDRTDLRSKMLIHNPLPFNLAADSVQYKIYIGGKEVIKSTYAKSLNIRRWDSSWIDMPVTVYNEKLLDALEKADKQGKDSVVYGIKSTFYTNIPFRKKFDVDVDKLLPLFYIPTASIEKLDFDSFSLKGVTLYINLDVGNRNKFPFQFKDMKYKFALADYPWVSGVKPGVIDIKEQDTTELTLPVRISFTGAFKSLGPLIRKGGKTDYKFAMDLKLVSDMNAIKNSKVVVNSEGQLKEIVQLAKDESKKAKEEKKQEKQQKKEERKEEKARERDREVSMDR
jgi:LEA14-like dessication related protein